MNAETLDLNRIIEERLRQVREVGDSQISIVRRNFEDLERLLEVYKRNKKLASMTGMNGLEEVALFLRNNGATAPNGDVLSTNAVATLMCRVRSERSTRLRANAEGTLEGLAVMVPKEPKARKVTHTPAPVPVSLPVAVPVPVVVAAPASTWNPMFPRPPVVVSGVEPVEVKDFGAYYKRLNAKVDKDVWTGEDQWLWEYFHDIANMVGARLPNQYMRVERHVMSRPFEPDCLGEILSKSRSFK